MVVSMCRRTKELFSLLMVCNVKLAAERTANRPPFHLRPKTDFVVLYIEDKTAEGARSNATLYARRYYIRIVSTILLQPKLGIVHSRHVCVRSGERGDKTLWYDEAVDYIFNG